MSDLVFWQEPGDNYVRVGEAKQYGYRSETETETVDLGYGEVLVAPVLLCRVRRHGYSEMVRHSAIRDVGSLNCCDRVVTKGSWLARRPRKDY